MKEIIYSQSFLEFLNNSKSKIAKILIALYNKHGIYNIRKSVHILSFSEINYITFRTNGMISYLPAGKECVYLNESEGTWSRENRQEGRPSKVIRKLFTKRAIELLKLKDHDFEGFSNSYKATFNEENYEFTLLPNSRIGKIYNRERGEGGSSLTGSCMNDYGYYMDIYMNCDQCKILILENSKKELIGRSLIWNFPELTLMDRIYVAHDHLYELFLEYAEKNNWWRKEDYKTYNNKTSLITPEGNSIIKKLTITTPTGFDNYPYIDTFSFGNEDFLTNYDDGYNDFTYDCTGGDRTSINGNDEENHDGEMFDDIDNEYIDEDDSRYVDRGTYSGEYTHYDNTIIDIDDNCWWCNDEGIVEHDGEWYQKELYVYCDNEETYIRRDEAVDIGNEYYHVDRIPENLLVEEL